MAAKFGCYEYVYISQSFEPSGKSVSALLPQPASCKMATTNPWFPGWPTWGA